MKFQYYINNILSRPRSNNNQLKSTSDKARKSGITKNKEGKIQPSSYGFKTRIKNMLAQGNPH